MAELSRGGLAPPGPDRFERVLAIAAIVLIALVAIALARGMAGGAHAASFVAAHLATVIPPLLLTPVLLLRRRGDRLHRVLGWIWALSMFATALVSFGVRDAETLRFSVIHLLSAVTLAATPLLVLSARYHKLARHRRAARALTTGALLIAGYFTLIPGRMLGAWLWG